MKIKTIEIKQKESTDENKGIVLVGGGKDSYAMVQILQKAKIDFDVLSINFSEYGDFKKQQEIILKMINSVKNNTTKVHHIDVQDFELFEYIESTGLKTVPGMFETPMSILLAFPIQLINGLKYVFIGNEKTADYPNLYWNKEGDINHQWGKSLEAEKALNSLMYNNLSTNFRFFSIIKPLRDPVIFQCCKINEQNYYFCHSCNIKKPWCLNCPKCVYVLLSSLAYMEDYTVKLMQEKGEVSLDFLNNESNQLFFKQFLGIEPNIPFECVGQTPDALVAFMLVSLKNQKGKAIDEFNKLKIKKEIMRKHIEKTFYVDEEYQFFPESIKQRILDVINQCAEEGKKKVLECLETYSN